MTQYLTPEQVLFLHSRLVAETGGGQGIRDLGMLLSALGRPQATFDEKDLYPDLFSKAAALMDSLVRNHPFVDGNKCTALAAAALFLRINGCLENGDKEGAKSLMEILDKNINSQDYPYQSGQMQELYDNLKQRL